MSPDRITALAAELTEADIAAIIRAKVPETIKGRAITHASVQWADYGDKLGVLPSVTVHAGRACAPCVPTFAIAIEMIERELPGPAEEAQQLRAKAAKLLADAAGLERSAA